MRKLKKVNLKKLKFKAIKKFRSLKTDEKMLTTVIVITVPTLLLGGCLYMGIIADRNNTNINTSEQINYISTTTPKITYTSTVITYITETTTANTTTTEFNYKPSDEPAVLSMSNTNTDDYTAYDSWDMYGTSMPTYYGDYIEVDSDLLGYIYRECKIYNVPYELALATCYIESTFNADVNNEGLNVDGSIDYGLMGLNGNYISENCMMYNNGIPIDLYNPYENAHIGIQILRTNLDYFGDSMWDAANAYNLGIGGWEEMNYYNGYWYYGAEILDYIELLYNEYNPY